MLIRPDKTLYRVQNEADLDEIINDHLKNGQPVGHLKVSGKTVGRKFLELAGIERIPLEKAVETFGALLASFLKTHAAGDCPNFRVSEKWDCPL